MHQWVQEDTKFKDNLVSVLTYINCKGNYALTECFHKQHLTALEHDTVSFQTR